MVSWTSRQMKGHMALDAYGKIMFFSYLDYVFTFEHSKVLICSFKNCHTYIFAELRFFGEWVFFFLVLLYILIMQLNAGNQKLTDVQRPSVNFKILNYTELHMATGMLCKYWHILVCFLAFYDLLNIFLCVFSTYCLRKKIHTQKKLLLYSPVII